MEEFTPITTQDELDRIIGDRLKRERENQAKKYADYDDLKRGARDYDQKIADLTKTVDEAAKKVAGLEAEKKDLSDKIGAYETRSVKMRIAREEGIPYEMAERLSGEDEEAIREDARAMARYVKTGAPPLADTEPRNAGSADEVYKKLIRGLRKEG